MALTFPSPSISVRQHFLLTSTIIWRVRYTRTVEGSESVNSDSGNKYRNVAGVEESCM